MTKIAKTIPTNDECQFWSDSRRLVILLMLARAGGPLTAAQIAKRASAAHETITKKLRSLARLGLVMRLQTKSGWHLTHQGWQLLHPNLKPPFPMQDAFLPDDLAESASQDSLYSAEHAQDSIKSAECGQDSIESAEYSQESIESTEYMQDSIDSAEFAQESIDSAELYAQASLASVEPHGQNSIESAESGMEHPSHNADSRQKTSQIRGISLKKEEESSKDSSLDSSLDSSSDSSSDLSDSSATKQPSQAELLAHSLLLFGPPGVLPHGLPERQARLVLGWLAQAYAQRSRLRVPAALVYARLFKGDFPAEPYRTYPERYLPPGYLAAVGMAPASNNYGRNQGDENDLEGIDHGPGDAEVFEDDEPDNGEAEEDARPVGNSLLVLDNGKSILAAWEQAVALLRPELSPASYHTYLEPCRPLCWQPPGRLVIAAPTPYARDWLESRLSGLLERALVGILAQQVTVEVRTEAEEEWKSDKMADLASMDTRPTAK